MRELNAISIDNIYHMLNQLNAKTVSEFMEGSKEYLNDSDYQGYLGKVQKELGECEHELISNFAYSKKEEGRRMLSNLERKHPKKHLDNYSMMKVVGKDEINRLDIGYKIYK